jgi:hypothetical protein
MPGYEVSHARGCGAGAWCLPPPAHACQGLIVAGLGSYPRPAEGLGLEGPPASECPRSQGVRNGIGSEAQFGVRISPAYHSFLRRPLWPLSRRERARCFTARNACSFLGCSGRRLRHWTRAACTSSSSETGNALARRANVPGFLGLSTSLFLRVRQTRGFIGLMPKLNTQMEMRLIRGWKRTIHRYWRSTSSSKHFHFAPIRGVALIVLYRSSSQMSVPRVGCWGIMSAWSCWCTGVPLITKSFFQ